MKTIGDLERKVNESFSSRIRNSFRLGVAAYALMSGLAFSACGLTDNSLNDGGRETERSDVSSISNNLVSGWDKNFSSEGWNTDVARSLAIDSSENIYVVGDGYNLVSVGSGSDWLIKKFNSSGVEDISGWNKSLGCNDANCGTALESANSVAIDSLDNVYIVGVVQYSDTDKDWLIKKFNSVGVEDTTNWNKSFTSGINSGYDVARSVAVDSSDNVYVVGTGYNLFTGTSGTDWWIKKFNSAGIEDTVNWNKNFTGNTSNSADVAYSVAIDSFDNVYVAGCADISGSGFCPNWLIKKFNSAGVEDTVNWNKTLIGSGSAYSVAIDSLDSVYVTGYGGNLAFNNSEYDWWIKKFNSNGIEDTVNWNKNFTFGRGGGTSEDRAYSVAIDFSDNVYVVGGVQNSDGGVSWLIKKFNSLGSEDTTSWNITYPRLGFNEPYSVAVDQSNNVYIAGYGMHLASVDSGLDWWVKKIEQGSSPAPQRQNSSPPNNPEQNNNPTDPPCTSILGYQDLDTDGKTTGTPTTFCNTLSQGFILQQNGEDCNDNEPSQWQIQEGYTDNDADGYTRGNKVQLCTGNNLPSGYSATSHGTDCDDNNPSKWQTLTGFVDRDGDAYTTGRQTSICTGTNLPAGYSATSRGTDCNDNDNTKWQTQRGYSDADNDGYTTSTSQNFCTGGTLPAGYQTAPRGKDCNDNNRFVWNSKSLYTDNDGDGYTVGKLQSRCIGATVPSGYSQTSRGQDCNDQDRLINPLAKEICDRKDNNCNGKIDEKLKLCFFFRRK